VKAVAMPVPFETRLKDGTPVRLELASQRDVEALEQLYRIIVEEGTSYPHDRMPDREEFVRSWLQGTRTVVAYPAQGQGGGELAGAFYLKPNWPGRAAHVANAGFIVAPEWRNRGLGSLLGETMLEQARRFGYRSVIFNLVFADNAPARHLWKKLGFVELALLPGAVRRRDGSYGDALIMWKSLMA
jgi:ribosomal protein S18 acetylase RimI-like enzyme